MLLFGMILAVLAASAIITHQKLEKTTQHEDLAANIAQGASELSYLSNDSLIYREGQQLSRWQSRFASLSNQVTSLNVEKPEQQVLVRNMKSNEQRLNRCSTVRHLLLEASLRIGAQLLTWHSFRYHGAEWQFKAGGWYRKLHV